MDVSKLLEDQLNCSKRNFLRFVVEREKSAVQLTDEQQNAYAELNTFWMRPNVMETVCEHFWYIKKFHTILNGPFLEQKIETQECLMWKEYVIATGQLRCMITMYYNKMLKNKKLFYWGGVNSNKI